MFDSQALVPSTSDVGLAFDLTQLSTAEAKRGRKTNPLKVQLFRSSLHLTGECGVERCLILSLWVLVPPARYVKKIWRCAILESVRLTCFSLQFDHQHVRRLSKRLVDSITSRIPDVVRNGDPDQTYEGNTVL